MTLLMRGSECVFPPARRTDVRPPRYFSLIFLGAKAPGVTWTLFASGKGWGSWKPPLFSVVLPPQRKGREVRFLAFSRGSGVAAGLGVSVAARGRGARGGLALLGPRQPPSQTPVFTASSKKDHNFVGERQACAVIRFIRTQTRLLFA